MAATKENFLCSIDSKCAAYEFAGEAGTQTQQYVWDTLVRIGFDPTQLDESLDVVYVSGKTVSVHFYAAAPDGLRPLVGEFDIAFASNRLRYFDGASKFTFRASKSEFQNYFSERREAVLNALERYALFCNNE